MAGGTGQTIAAVDLGSNSFRLQVARVEGDHLYPLDSLKETVRLAAGLDADKRLDAESIKRAVKCLARFGERLRGLPADSVRVVGTNTLRVAKNSAELLQRGERALGFPIEIIAGREEARLIYLGVSHNQPPSPARRLVVDIGGGSTEFIIGVRHNPLKTESLYMGCVSYSRRYFPDGKVTRARLADAELAARTELLAIAHEFRGGHWQEAIASSGTARALQDIMELNGMSAAGISAAGMDKLRELLLRVGDPSRLQLEGLRPERVAVLPGGFAIMSAVFSSLGVERMNVATAALREGVLHDLFGRIQHHDVRETTIGQFMKRYHVDAGQARRVALLAGVLLRQLGESMVLDECGARRLEWAARLHEIGLAIAHAGYHKHSASLLSKTAEI